MRKRTRRILLLVIIVSVVSPISLISRFSNLIDMDGYYFGDSIRSARIRVE